MTVLSYEERLAFFADGKRPRRFRGYLLHSRGRPAGRRANREEEQQRRNNAARTRNNERRPVAHLVDNQTVESIFFRLSAGSLNG